MSSNIGLNVESIPLKQSCSTGPVPSHYPASVCLRRRHRGSQAGLRSNSSHARDRSLSRQPRFEHEANTGSPLQPRTAQSSSADDRRATSARLSKRERNASAPVAAASANACGARGRSTTLARARICSDPPPQCRSKVYEYPRRNREPVVN